MKTYPSPSYLKDTEVQNTEENGKDSHENQEIQKKQEIAFLNTNLQEKYDDFLFKITEIAINTKPVIIIPISEFFNTDKSKNPKKANVAKKPPITDNILIAILDLLSSCALYSAKIASLSNSICEVDED